MTQEVYWSGMPYISYGDLRKATAVAKKNLQALEGHLARGYSIVSTEPTAVYMFREVCIQLSYPARVPRRQAR